MPNHKNKDFSRGYKVISYKNVDIIIVNTDKVFCTLTGLGAFIGF